MKFKRLLLEAAVMAALLLGVALWQGRTLVSGAAPPLDALTTGGAPVDLAATKGPTLIYFWATWCPICRFTSPNVNAVAVHHRVVTVALQSGTPHAIDAFLKEKGLAFPVVADPNGAIAARWGVRGVPAIFVIDSHGTIRFATVGYSSRWGMETRLWAATWY